MDRESFKKHLESLYSVTRHFSSPMVLEWLAEGGESASRLHIIAGKCKTKRNEIMTAWDVASESEKRNIENRLKLDQSVFSDV